MKNSIEKCNPFIRAAELQRAVLEGESLRMAYDNRLFCVVENEGVFITQDQQYNISKGCVIFVPPSVGYCFRGKVKAAVINFDMTRGFDSQKKPICPPTIHFFDKAQCFDASVTDGFEKTNVYYGCDFLIPEFLELVTTFNKKDKFSDALTSSQLKSIMTKLLMQTDFCASPESQLVAKVDGYIRTYASEISGNTDIAKQFGYHPVYLASVYKAEKGKTLHSAIVEERLRLCCRWLSQTSASLEQIAQNTGFCSRAHFCTVFKAKMNMSPSEWRAKGKQL